MILKSLIVGPIAANCYILGDENTKQGVIIDPGSEADRVLEMVKETGLTIKFIIATHGHFDHTAAVGPLKNSLGCDFLLHQEDIPFVRHAKEAARAWGFDIDQVPDPDKFLKDGDILNLGGLELKIIHTPGHSPGGISIHLAREKVLFTGDTLFQGSIGRTDLQLGSMEDLIRSIKEKLYVLPDDTVAFCGHGDQTTIGEEKKYNFFVRSNSENG
jgi:glyoxylase-like metal-dependent hydrolase (beta-lactamase superfamily II)